MALTWTVPSPQEPPNSPPALPLSTASHPPAPAHRREWLTHGSTCPHEYPRRNPQKALVGAKCRSGSQGVQQKVQGLQTQQTRSQILLTDLSEHWVFFSRGMRIVSFRELFVFNFIYLSIFGCAELSLRLRLFSSCREWGLLFSCSEWASHCGGFSLRSAGSGCVGSVVAAPEL